MKTKRRILLVDDDRSIVLLLRLVLERQGYGILTAFDGPEGLHTAWEEKPDLVILDIQMPSMDGYEVCLRLHDKPETAKIPVIMLTTKGRLSGLEGLGAKRILHKRIEERMKGFNVGAIEFLSKPIVAKAVVDAVEKAFRVAE